MATEFSKEILLDEAHSLVDEQTRALDVVASWETLCGVYRILEFSDPLSDTVRLEEFKWIIKMMNSFLTKQRKKLLTCVDLESMMTVLQDSFTPEGKVNISGRRELAYQKLRQKWITNMLIAMEQKMQDLLEGSNNGWTDRNDAYGSE